MATGTEQRQLAEAAPEELAALERLYADFAAAHMTPPRTQRSSSSWWEHFDRYHGAFEPWQSACHFLSRSIGDGRLTRRALAFVADTHRMRVSRHGAEPLESPLAVGGMTFYGRLPGDVAASYPPESDADGRRQPT